MAKTGVRHLNLRGEPVGTSLGTVDLDKFGEVVQLPTGVIKEGFIAATGGNFLDIEVHGYVRPGPNDVVETVEKEVPAEVKSAPVVEKKAPNVLSGMEPDLIEQVKGVMEGLLKDPKNLNSVGALDMSKLNASLKRAGITEALSGAQRDAIAAQLT